MSDEAEVTLAEGGEDGDEPQPGPDEEETEEFFEEMGGEFEEVECEEDNDLGPEEDNEEGADEEDNEPGEGDEDNEETVEEIVASNLQAGGTMSIEEAALAAHNRFRAKHRVGPLVLDRQLCAYARNWAFRIANMGRMVHNPARKYGENIYMCWSSNGASNCSGATPVNAWYSEVSRYNFRSGRDPGLQAGHFTQVVWKGSKRLGIAMAKMNNKTFVVANYYPPGNYTGQYLNNVFS